MKIGRLLFRLVVGGFFVGHGTQKLFGWFGGHGLDGTGQFFEGNLGLKPGRHHALAAGLSEAGGGALVALGAATPLAAATLVATMLTAINRVHLKNGPWASDGGYEYNLVLIASLLALVEAGPGSPSLDAVRGREQWGTSWTVLTLLLGAGGAAAAHAYAESQASVEQPPAEPTPATPSTSPAETPAPAAS
jgi:putative oxidoreductase